jgi:small ubiquitin-related modifier
MARFELARYDEALKDIEVVFKDLPDAKCKEDGSKLKQRIEAKLVKSPQRDIQHAAVTLKVRNQQSSVLQFKILKSTPLRKLMDSYCSRLGLQVSQMRFTVNGKCVASDDTAENLGLEDDDLIEAVMET